MRALSMWEPWASLVPCGAKRWETRCWSTRYRGPLLICASKGGLAKYELQDLLCDWRFVGGLGPLIGKPLDLSANSWYNITFQDLNFGKAVAIVDLVNCKRTEDMTQGEIGTDRPFGDFGRGRYGWQFENVYALKEPFPVRGAQGIFNVEDYTEEVNQYLNSVETANEKEYE